MSTLKVFKLILLGCLLASCTYREEKGSNSYKEIIPSEKLIAKASFAQVYNEVFRPKCIACHGTNGNVNLESYGEAKNNLSKIKQITLIERKMPMAPYPPLNDQELMTLAAWIFAGGPELPSNGEPPPPPPPPLKPEFLSIKKNIFEVKCMSCHSSNGEAKKIPLDDLDFLINSPKEIVIPGNAEESGVVLVLQENAIKKMPPPESNIEPVKPEEIKIIEEWINNGAQD